jgi:hypothetical protein
MSQIDELIEFAECLNCGFKESNLNVQKCEICLTDFENPLKALSHPHLPGWQVRFKLLSTGAMFERKKNLALLKSQKCDGDCSHDFCQSMEFVIYLMEGRK